MMQSEADRIARVAATTALASEIFGGREKSFLWLSSSHERLSGKTPLSMLQTESGKEIVESLLWAIDEGVYS